MANKPSAAEQAAPPSAPPRPSEMMARLARREMEKKAEGRRSAREELTHAPADRKDLSAPPPPAAAPPPPSAPEPAIAAGQSQQSALQLETAQKELAAPAARANTLRDQEAGAAGQPRAAKGAISGSIAGFGAALGALKSPALSYSVLRRDENGRFAKLDANIAVRQGDLVRLAVTPAASGYLSLYERDANGAWKPIPLGSTNEEGVPVNANTQYVVPQQPIEVTAQEQIRLVLSPESAAADAVAERDAARAKTSAVERPTSRRAAPIAVDINLTRKN